MYDAGMGSRNAGEESEGNLVRVVHFVDRRALVKFLLLSNCCAISSASVCIMSGTGLCHERLGLFYHIE